MKFYQLYSVKKHNWAQTVINYMVRIQEEALEQAMEQTSTRHVVAYYNKSNTIRHPGSRGQAAGWRTAGSRETFDEFSGSRGQAAGWRTLKNRGMTKQNKLQDDGIKQAAK